MLERLIKRLQQCHEIDEIVVATTENEADDCICKLATSLGVNYFRGSEKDVLSRVLFAAKKFQIQIIVEITGDCPVIDVGLVKEALATYLESNVDYVSNSNVRSYPDGMDVQIYSTEVLHSSYVLATSNLEREHVTLHIRKNPQLYSRIDLIAPQEFHFPELGLTLDTIEDFVLLDKIICDLEPKNPSFSLKEMLELLKSQPELLKINNQVLRKGDS